MNNNIEWQHQMYLAFLNQPILKNEVKSNSPLNRKRYQEHLDNGNVKSEKEVSFVNFFLDMSAREYYLSSLPGGRILLIHREFKSIVTFIYCTTITKETKKILTFYNECIEIEALHSKEKGQGFRIMSELINLSQNIQIPLSLYAETEELVKYYQQYDFVNHGRLGENNEFLMLRVPDNSGI